MNPNRFTTGINGPIRRAAMLVAVTAFALVPPATVWAQSPTVVGCGSVISVPGHYALGADETCSGDGITIAASSVRLNLAGFTLSGPEEHDTAGVRADGVSDVRITSGAIVGFGHGIEMSNVSNLHVVNVRTTGHLDQGMSFTNLDGSRISGCDISNNGFAGIFIESDSDDNDIIGNTASFNGTTGIHVFHRSNDRNRIVGNRATDNRIGGIQVYGTDSLVLGNTVTDNGADPDFEDRSYGIYVGSVTNVTILGNVATRNPRGIWVSGLADAPVTVLGNLVRSNRLVDMLDEHLPSCVIRWKRNIFVTDNEGDGPRAGCIR
jgi:parallel beta-helix repeat protein